MLRSPNQRANQTRRFFKNEEFDWLFDFVTVTWKNNLNRLDYGYDDEGKLLPYLETNWPIKEKRHLCK